MRRHKTLYVPREKAHELERFCKEPPGSCGRGETVFDEEITFDNGMRMVIQVVASENPAMESCWTQGVLFNPAGEELAMTSSGDQFLGEYEIVDDEDDEYVVTVQVAVQPAPDLLKTLPPSVNRIVLQRSVGGLNKLWWADVDCDNNITVSEHEKTAHEALSTVLRIVREKEAKLVRHEIT